MKRVLIITPILILVLAVFFTFSNPASSSQHTTLGSDNRGSVTKDVYSYSDAPKAKIAVVTGMHPRELLATNLVPEVLKKFAKENQVEIVSYHINVTAYPENFYTGRNNGEALANKYAVPDIDKSDCQLVIIAHDHEKGYGNGSYIATPTRDEKSLAMGDAVRKIQPTIRFYPGISNPDPVKSASSVLLVSKPVADAGKPLFVYEMPEWIDKDEAAQTTYQLLDACFKALQK